MNARISSNSLVWELIFNYLDVDVLQTCYFVCKDFQNVVNDRLKVVHNKLLLTSLMNVRGRYITIDSMEPRNRYLNLIFDGYYNAGKEHIFSCADCHEHVLFESDEKIVYNHKKYCSFNFKRKMEMSCTSYVWYIFHPFRRRYWHFNYLKRYVQLCFPWVKVSLAFKKKIHICALRVNFKYSVTKAQILSEFKQTNQPLIKKVSTSEGLELILVPGTKGWKTLNKGKENKYETIFVFSCLCNHSYCVCKYR